MSKKKIVAGVAIGAAAIAGARYLVKKARKSADSAAASVEKNVHDDIPDEPFVDNIDEPEDNPTSNAETSN